MQPEPIKGRSGILWPFVIAWIFCVFFYFLQYALRSAPGVMVPELTSAFGLSALGVSALVGLYYYTYSAFAIVSGACFDRYGAKYVVPVGLLLLAAGAVLFGVGSGGGAQIGRLLQGAGSAFAFTGAVYLASHGFPARYLATAIGFTQCFGMLGGAAGQFAVAPLIHGVLSWQQFWIFGGIVAAVIAVAVVLVTPGGHDVRTKAQGSIWSMFTPYRSVLANPQSYLCGFAAGLLFLPTTVGDMIWGVSFLRVGWNIDYAEAVNRTAMVPLGWVIGCPLLGYLADRLGRRKPVLIGGAAFMLAMSLIILYLPHGIVPPYLAGFLLGVGSGAAMIPYAMIKELNADTVKGSATGAINFLVFTFSALMAPAYGWLLVAISDGAPLTLSVFQKAGALGIGGIVLAIVLSFFIRETGAAILDPIPGEPLLPAAPKPAGGAS
ncbi:MFS transporter [Xanthobacter versatilis]|uniref:MFS transporter n=1 Tax=Xanthobacter autotrophicus (strain ATCC BAA-1158 / Py2) TaxID=78245 RepID=UPI003726EF15